MGTDDKREPATAVTKVVRTPATPLSRAQATSQDNESDDEPLPNVPERFEVVGVLGRGGMGVVLEVHDRVLDRDVALKVMNRARTEDPSWRKRFLREARAAGTLRHPGIVTVHEFSDEGTFIVMELVRGESLRARLRREGALAPAEVRRIGLALLDALAAAHTARVVHRDVKPSNVLLDESGHVRLADFGVASFGDANLTTTGTQVGTPGYMAPEQLRGRTVDHRADVYSAGATLFEAATGHALHSDEVAKSDPVTLLAASTHDDALAGAIAGAVQERVSDRWQSAAIFEERLSRPAAEPRRRNARWAVGAAIVAALVVGGALGARAWWSDPPSTLAIDAREPLRQRSPASQTRVLQNAIANIEANQLEAARTSLETLLEANPLDHDANYYLAVLGFWGSEHGEVAAIERALVDANPERAVFLRSLAVLKTNDYVAALASFAAAASQYPRNRDIAYGLFESNYHVGHPKPAMASYRLVTELSPGFQLGLLHPLTHYAATGDHDGMAWALSRAQTFGQQGSRLWSVRALVSQRRYAEAETEIAAVLEGARGPVTDQEREGVKRDLAQILATTGRLEASERIAKERGDPFALWGVSAARGADADRLSYRDQALASARRADAYHDGTAVSLAIGRAHLVALVGLALEHTMEPDPRLAVELLEVLNVPSSLDGSRRMELAGARALVGGIVGDEALIAESRSSSLPEASAIGDAFHAQSNDAVSDEIAAWRRAIAHSVDGRYLLVEQVLLARALRRAGDSRRLLEVCAEIVDPHLFLNWAWGLAVGPCLLWSGESAAKLGRAREAEGFLRRLIALRSGADGDDSLIRAARARLR